MSYYFAFTPAQIKAVQAKLDDKYRSITLRMEPQQLLGGKTEVNVSKVILRKILVAVNKNKFVDIHFAFKQMKQIVEPRKSDEVMVGGLAPLAVLGAAQTGMEVFNSATAENQARVGNKIDRRLKYLRGGSATNEKDDILLKNEQDDVLLKNEQDDVLLKGIKAGMEKAKMESQGGGWKSDDVEFLGGGFWGDFVDGFAFGFNPMNWPKAVELLAAEIDGSGIKKKVQSSQSLKSSSSSTTHGSRIAIF
jgi:hypothetical protein